MRQIIDHHDGHGLNDHIDIKSDELGPGGAAHSYELMLDGRAVASIQFQKGPRNEPESTPGVTEAAIAAVLIDRLRSFQDGPFSCRENAIALTHLETAALWMRKRTDERARRGVLGRNLK